MPFYDKVLRAPLFRLEPERAHNLALWFISHGLVGARRVKDALLEQELFGVRFTNPLGLAAGFDKDGVALNHWHKLGFGFVEIGTVTALSQPGNPKPRLIRLPDDKALINRLGFNNHGAPALASKLASSRPRLPVGVNLGKSKATPLDEASSDYRTSFRSLHKFGDYFVINVSSPNTPGLRDLQDKGALQDIIAAMREVDASRPLFVKVSPDLTPSALDDVVDIVRTTGLTGVIATNTTTSRKSVDTDEPGGLSGAPLRDRANEVLAHLYRACDKDTILIGVGGIMSGQDLVKKIQCGAHLCQTYSGWVYGGPAFVPSALRELRDHLRTEGTTLHQLRGSDMK